MFSPRVSQRVTLVPDPCTLLIDGVTFGLTSSDILFHMGAEEISWWGGPRAELCNLESPHTPHPAVALSQKMNEKGTNSSRVSWKTWQMKRWHPLVTFTSALKMIAKEWETRKMLIGSCSPQAQLLCVFEVVFAKCVCGCHCCVVFCKHSSLVYVAVELDQTDFHGYWSTSWRRGGRTPERARVFSVFLRLANINATCVSVLTWSYYPLYPPVEEVNMDYEKFQSFGQMPLTPDVLIIPSELRYFVKVRMPHHQNFWVCLSFTKYHFVFVDYSFLNPHRHLSSGCGWLRLRQSRTTDQRPGGRDIRQTAHSAQRDDRGREESEPLLGCSGGENLTVTKDFKFSASATNDLI